MKLQQKLYKHSQQPLTILLHYLEKRKCLKVTQIARAEITMLNFTPAQTPDSY